MRIEISGMTLRRERLGEQIRLSPTELLDDHRVPEPPDSIPNSVVKRCIADGSVGSPHVRVGHRQASNRKPNNPAQCRVFGLWVWVFVWININNIKRYSA